MHAFRDTTADVREPKSARLEQRIKPRVKQIIEQAANTLGVDTSDFVINAAYKEAIITLEAYSRTILDKKNSADFFSAIDRISQPNDAMASIMEHYERAVGNAIK